MAGATGATVNIHYCMGEYAGWELGHDEAKSCSSCGMDKKDPLSDNCCKDEHKSIKLDDVHKTAENFAVSLQAPSIVLSPYELYPSPKVISLSENYPVNHAPPGTPQEAAFIFIRSIRI